jgi:peptidoglycan/xylan/chitin deacetylase (PgdA/CDA1 family)
MYYRLKPMIPWIVRMELRRARARRLLRRFGASWPIDEGAGRTPVDWPGWPQGKQFALVLTHDVEGLRGLEQCARLAEMELRMGFRSSFNFVPEGVYATPDSLRARLEKQGFEVGVHDLHHDGSLYRSRASFRAQAERINHYLAAWRAGGFRSGFMFHNLHWLKELDIAYDSSTFDTDPFEPQPDGVRTIFPFWVARSAGSGYVELPYTLPQDVTLFIVLRETSIDVWKRKLDWLAAHGGLALVNVHPDYLAFDGQSHPNAYPAALYEAFLEHVASRYSDRCWHALPRDVAKYVVTQRSALAAAESTLKAAG